MAVQDAVHFTTTVANQKPFHSSMGVSILRLTIVGGRHKIFQRQLPFRNNLYVLFLGQGFHEPYHPILLLHVILCRLVF